MSKWLIIGVGVVCLTAIIGGVVFTLNVFSQDKSPAAVPVQEPPPTEQPVSIDRTAPVITEVFVLATGRSGAAITWTTDEAATTQVVYGLNQYYSSTTALDNDLITNHTVILSGLTSNTTYNFKVKSRDASGNESVSQDYTLVTSRMGTLVGGIIGENTTWTASNNPYIITSTILLPTEVTLTIQPGTSVLMSGDGEYMFEVNGEVIAHGVPGSRITLNANGHSFFSCENAGPEASVDLSYCSIENGTSLIAFARGFNLRHSEVTDLPQNSDISFGPSSDVYIEYNNFTSASGFITGGAKVYVRYNHFYSRNRSLQDMPWIVNKAGPATIVNYNWFFETDGIAVMLEGGSGTEGIEAAYNYWGTYNITVIDAMLWDKNDNPDLASYIDYLPTRNSPEPIRQFTF